MDVYNCREGKAKEVSKSGAERGWQGRGEGRKDFSWALGADCRLPASGITEQEVSVV